MWNVFLLRLRSFLPSPGRAEDWGLSRIEHEVSASGLLKHNNSRRIICYRSADRIITLISSFLLYFKWYFLFSSSSYTHTNPYILYQYTVLMLPSFPSPKFDTICFYLNLWNWRNRIKVYTILVFHIFDIRTFQRNLFHHKIVHSFFFLLPLGVTLIIFHIYIHITKFKKETLNVVITSSMVRI